MKKLIERIEISILDSDSILNDDDTISIFTEEEEEYLADPDTDMEEATELMYECAEEVMEAIVESTPSYILEEMLEMEDSELVLGLLYLREITARQFRNIGANWEKYRKVREGRMKARATKEVAKGSSSVLLHNVATQHKNKTIRKAARKELAARATGQSSEPPRHARPYKFKRPVCPPGERMVFGKCQRVSVHGSPGRLIPKKTAASSARKRKSLEKLINDMRQKRE